MNKKVAVYSASLDPVTYGHVWVVQTLLNMVDQVVVAVADNPDKIYMWDQEERVRLASMAFSDHNVKVKGIGKKLTVDYASEIDASFLVRGIRDEKDLSDEKKLLNINRTLSTIPTIFLIPPKELEFVSSSFVKGLMKYDNWKTNIRLYCPLGAVLALEQAREEGMI